MRSVGAYTSNLENAAPSWGHAATRPTSTKHHLNPFFQKLVHCPVALVAVKLHSDPTWSQVNSSSLAQGVKAEMYCRNVFCHRRLCASKLMEVMEAIN